MIRPGPDVQRAITSTNIRKARTPTWRAQCFADARRQRQFVNRLAFAARCLLLAAVLSLRPRGALASDAGPRTVVIMSEGRTEAVSQRLRQEIEALGFEVKFEAETMPLRSLEAVADGARAMATIRVKSMAAGGVEMTVLDRVTGKTVHRELARATPGDPAGEELVATRTVELFRASLMELAADHPARGDVQASAPVEALVLRDQEEASRRAGTVSLAAGPAVLVMPKWQPSAELWLSAAWVSRAGLGFSAAGFTALSSAHLARSEGSVDLTARTYRLGASWDVCAVRCGLSARFGAGWSLTQLSLRGTASAPYVALHAERVAWGPWLSASGRLTVSEHVALLLELSGALSLPNESVRFAGQDVADFARPAFLAALAPELFWP